MANVRYKISGSYDNSAANQAKNGLLALGESVNKLNTMFNMFVGAKIFQQLGKVVNDTVRAFEVQQKAIAQLTNSISNNSKLTEGSLKRIIDFTGQLQKKGIYGDEVLQEQASYLASLGLTEVQIKKTLEASANMAAKGIMPLEGAVKNLAKTYGGLAGELGEKIPALRNLTKEQLQAGEAIALVQQTFAGSLETAADTLQGRTQQVQNIIGDIKEKIGTLFGVAKLSILNTIQPVLSAIDEWLEKNLPRILNFFLNFPEIARLAFSTAGELLKNIFTIDFWTNYLSAVGSFIIASFKASFNVIVELIKVLGQTIWIPLQWGFENFIYAIQTLFTKAINGILKGVAWVVDALNKIPGINIETSGLKAGLAGPTAPDQNPDTKLFSAWKNFGTSFVNEMKELGTSYKTTLSKVSNPLVPVFDDFTENINQILNKDLPENIKNAISGAPILINTETTESTTTPEGGSSYTNLLGDMNPLSLLMDFLSPLTDLFNSLTSIKLILDPLQILFKAIFDVLSPIIDSILRPVIGAVQIVGETIGKMLAPILIALTPVIELLAKAFIFTYNYAIRPFANAIIWVISVINNTIASVVNGIIKLINKLPGVNIKWRMQTMDYDEMKLEKIDSSDLNSAGDRAGVGNNYSGGTSASYAGQRDITNNFYINVETINGTNTEAAIEFWNTLVSLSKTNHVQLNIGS